jgi:hypothetical protein
MGDQLANLDRIDEIRPCLAEPGLDRRNGGPSIKRRVEFDRLEVVLVDRKPLSPSDSVGIEMPLLMPIVPARAPDIDGSEWLTP